MTTWKIKHTHCTHAHENTEPTDTATAQTHRRQMPYISFVQVSGMGMVDTCPANKVTVICAILFQNNGHVTEDSSGKHRIFPSCVPTQRLLVWKALSGGT